MPGAYVLLEILYDDPTKYFMCNSYACHFVELSKKIIPQMLAQKKM